MKLRESKRNIGVVFLVILFFIAALILISTIIIPSFANKAFGPPTDDLSISQKVILPIKLYLGKSKLLAPPGFTDEEISFEIDADESAISVCIKLEQIGLISDSELLKDYLIYKGYDRLVQSGVFILRPSMTALEIAEEITEPVKKNVTFVVLPGWRIEEIAKSLPTSGLNIDSEEFINLAYHPSITLSDKVGLPAGTSLEGFLFPHEYTIPRDVELTDFISLLLDEFSKNVNNELIDAFESQNLNLKEAVTLASIIQREAVIESEQPLIASVFFNRLNIGMRLETDPTVQYALGMNTLTGEWWKSPLSYKDLTVASSYNTYLVYGLPPGPICNPTISALIAVANPAESPYYYFRSACDSSLTHNFSITYDEHLGNECP